MNKTVFIVDDDVNFRYAIRELVPWKENGYTVAGEAIHGRQAMELLRKKPADIVLTDMEMPLMDGVELTKQIKEEFPDTVVVAMSAYDDFNFVKESMRLGAQDYILKQDFDPDRLLDVLETLSRKQDAGRQQDLSVTRDRDAFIRYLRGQRKLNEIEVPDFFRDRKRMIVFLVDCREDRGFADYEDLSEMRILFSAKLPDMRFLFIAEMPEAISASRQLEDIRKAVGIIKRLFRSELWLGYSDHPCGIEDLPLSFARAEAALFYKLYEPKSHVFCYQEYAGKDAMRERTFIYRASGTECDEEKLLAAMSEEVQKKLPDRDALYGCFVQLFRVFHDNNQFALEDQRFKGFYNALESCPTFEEMCRVFLKYAGDVRREQEEISGVHREIRIAKEYIAARFSEDITLKELAEYTGLSENYFSNLFKKEIGVGLKVYINNVRIREAKRLLTETSLKDYEVAEQVGYHNATYFASIFRKVAGESVSDFRRHKKS